MKRAGAAGFRVPGSCRRVLAAGLCYTSLLSFAWAQQEAAIAPIRPHAPIIVRPYRAATIPPARLGNTARLRDLVRGGILYLTVQDAIALALENNIDIEVARYNPLLAAWNLERSEAGGALPGVPSGASQAGSVAAGQGVAGSQQAAGVSISGTGVQGGGSVNATISQVGPVTQTLDPVLQETSTFTHKTTPYPNTVQSLTSVLIDGTRAHTATFQQGLISGGNVSVNFNDSFLNENALSNELNPSSSMSASVRASHNLLRGFGVAVNARTINIQKMNLRMSDTAFKQQVINTIANVLNAYYNLAADYDDAKSKQSEVEAAQTFYSDSQKQLKAGTLSPLDVTTAESQVAAAQQDLIVSNTSLRQQEIQLKNLLSRNGLSDPLIAETQIVPMDRIVVPEKEDLPPVSTLVKQAIANRTDIALDRANFESAQVSALGTKNGILPVLQVFASESNAGLAGTQPPIIVVPGQPVNRADPYFVGGAGTALGQIFRRNFPSNRAGVFFSTTVHERQAQADYGIDQLSLRQTALLNQKDVNQVQVEVTNSVVAVRQARARYDAAVHNRILDEQLLDAEQRKYKLGASTPYNIIVQERDLAVARASETAALVSYSNARVLLDQMLGRTLEANGVNLSEALSGHVTRVSTPAPSPAPVPKP